jgi:hypothetical protein
VGSLDARLDQTIVVPRTPPGEIELARVSFRTSVIERLETELYKAPETYVKLSGSSRYRFMTSVSPDGLLLSVPPDVNYHDRWRIPQVVSLRFSRIGWPGVGQIHIDFETVKVRAS